VEWVKDDRITLEAFDGWWGGKPSVRRMVLRPVPNEASRAAALISGEVDIVPALAPAMMDTLKGRSGVKVEIADGYKVVYLGFNPSLPALSNVLMRQAIDMAIDREAITKQLLRGMGEPVNQIVAPVTFGYDPGRPAPPFDPKKARELVQASGYDGTPILLEYPNDFIAAADQVAAAVAGYLEAVGIKTRLSGMEYNTFYAQWSAKKLSGMHMFVFGPSLLDADVPIHSIFATSGNRGYIFSPKVDELAAASRAVSDPAKRLKVISELWRASDEHKPFVYLYNEKQAVGLREGVTWKPQPDGVIRMWQVTKVAR
jgi:peptide/nickel transport system substrate-binding protein